MHYNGQLSLLILLTCTGSMVYAIIYSYIIKTSTLPEATINSDWIAYPSFKTSGLEYPSLKKFN